MLSRTTSKFRNQLLEVERQIGPGSYLLCSLSSRLHTLCTKVKSLEARAEDVENFNRRNNLRIIGPTESTEGQDPALFSERLLCTLLPRLPFSPLFTVKRAHRMPLTRGPPVAAPLTFIICLISVTKMWFFGRQHRRANAVRGIKDISLLQGLSLME